MKITKKLMAIVLTFCMFASISLVSGFATTTDKSSTSATTASSAASQELDDKYGYNGNDLGATYTPESTTFKVWAPTATKVDLNLYTTGSDNEEGADDLGSCELEFDKTNGVWSTTVDGDYKNVYYTYSITAANGNKTSVKETQDIYSVATGVNGKRSMVCDLSDTDPEGWDNDKHVVLDKSTESSVWEIHIKDFSYDENSGVSKANRGKYLGFTETGTTLNGEGKTATCIDYLKELGITTVQINPFYDFGSVDETGSDSQFNWGYDPVNYNVPEGSYSTNPYDGNVRIKECKEMIKALHDAGISVVMDVVYNHTYSYDSCFEATVPNYYYRMKADGTYSNGSGCGNETATERLMFRNYVIQSCLYWVNEYHVDGFRFDLMGIMDVETMNMIRAELDKVDPKLTMWGEGWTGGTCTYPDTTCTGEKLYLATQSNASKLNDRIAFFNDSICDGIKGNSADIYNKGFVQGDKTKTLNVKYGVRANSTIDFNWRANAPSQCVTYSSCHDNATLYDQILGSTSLASYGNYNVTAVKMNKLAAAILYASQGISFMQAGEEMCRSKDGDTNSYKSAATVNMINWQNLVDYGDVVSYYKGMMQIKSKFSPLNCMDKSYQNAFIFNDSQNKNPNQIAYTIKNNTEGEWSKLAVIFNSAGTTADVTLEDTSVKDWVVIANNESAGLDKLGEVTGSTFKVPAYSAVIAVDKESYEATGIHSDMGKVVVNYVHEKNNKKLVDSVVLQGSIGTGYCTSFCAVPVIPYELSEVKGDVKGIFSETPAEVTYYFKDYVPQSIDNADFNGDGKINVRDVTTIQKYLVGTLSLSQNKIKCLDLNYDNNKNISDCTMLSKYLAGYPVAEGRVVINYCTYEDGIQLAPSKTITGRVGSEYKADAIGILDYALDETKLPDNAEGIIPYGADVVVNYYYLFAGLDTGSTSSTETGIQ
ncbi:MAG: type I pullulanase [Ruminococcus sp.]